MRSRPDAVDNENVEEPIEEPVESVDSRTFVDLWSNTKAREKDIRDILLGPPPDVRSWACFRPTAVRSQALAEVVGALQSGRLLL